MTRTILTDYSNLLLTIYRQAQELPVDEFQDQVLNAIKPHLPFDTSMWGTARMTAKGIDIHSLHLHETSQAMIDAYEKVKHLDVAAVRVTEQPTATIAFSTTADFQEPELEPLRAFLHEFRHRTSSSLRISTPSHASPSGCRCTGRTQARSARRRKPSYFPASPRT